MERLVVIAVISILCLVGESLFASVDIPLTWKSMHIQTADHGGAEIRATVDDKGRLDTLDIVIRGSAVSFSESCLEGLVRPYLNGLNLSYGQSAAGRSYWSIEIPFDGNDSVRLGSIFNLMFSQDALLWSYKSIQIDENSWEDVDVCPLAISNSE